VEFDWKNKRFKYVDNVKGREPKIEEGNLEILAVDILSSLYLVRAKALKIGEDVLLDIHSGKNWPLVVKVLRRETVKVAAGKFDCFVVEPHLRNHGLFVQKGRKLTVWITADERRIPVRMEAEILIGSVSAELKDQRR
jgi:hypothetical protein